MSTEQNKAVARRWYEEGSNKHNAAVIDDLFTAGFVTHNSGDSVIDVCSMHRPIPVSCAASQSSTLCRVRQAFWHLHRLH